MDKFEVARCLREIAAHLELAKESGFKVRAYERGARAMEQLRDSLEVLVAEQRLTEQRAIGPALARVITDLVTTGSSPVLEEARRRHPPGVGELARVPGLTLPRIQALHAALGVTSLAELEQALDDGRVAGVKGFGPATIQRLREGIAEHRSPAAPAEVILADALAEAEPLVEYLRAGPGVKELEVAGELRRRLETTRAIDVVVGAADPHALIRHAAKYPAFVNVLREEADEVLGRLEPGITARVVATPPAHFGTTLFRATGPTAHVQALEAFAHDRRRRVPAVEDEAEVYTRLGLACPPPELRDHASALRPADDSRAFELLRLRDIRGMVHCHTVFSDGKHTVEEMARAAQAMGMKYITITDHSPTAHYAGGLDVDRLKEQWDEIARVQELVQIRILRGTESDILADGALDYPDHVLEQLDVVIASVHGRMKMDEEAMTTRIVRAMRQPVFKIWGHALGRLLLRRPPFACQLEKVLDAVAESRAAIEINGDPYRLDLAPDGVRLARERGIRFVVSVDAHSTRALGNLQFGVDMARRGGLHKEEVLNTLGTREFVAQVRPAA